MAEIRSEEFDIEFYISDKKVTGHVIHFLDSNYPSIPDLRVTVDSEYKDKVFTYYITKGPWPLFWFPIAPPEFPFPKAITEHERLVHVNECISRALIDQILNINP